MAAGDPILINLSGATFLLTAETGGIIQSEDREVSSSEKVVFDASKGYDVGEVDYNFVAMQNFSAIVNGSTGIAAAQPGVALTLANSLGIGSAQNGVASGGLYTKTVRIQHAGESLREISGTTKQRAGIS